jgi:ligand-binding sensor domain-containing protein/DNA-binding CsgD family transcriptional regulator
MSKPFSVQVFLLAVLLFVLPEIVFSQGVNLGDPPVLNFSKKAYKAGTQVWDIAQDARGVMWFGNNEGLLEFDGIHWRLHPLPNRTIVRSVRAGLKGRVYVGGQDEFGYFAPEPNGSLAYHSLKPLVPNSEQRLGDVWNISVRSDGVFFRTDHQVFHYQDEQLTPLFPAGGNMHFMGDWQGKLLMQDGQFRLYTFENGRLQALQRPAEFRFGTISGVLQYSSDTTLVTTIKNGIFYFDGHQFIPWKTQDDPFLKNNIIFCSGMLNDGKIALGTSLNGLVTLDRQRRIYHHLNKTSGLQNNTILSLFAPKQGGLWLGLDNGIDFVDVHSPFTTIFPDGELQGTGYSAQVFGGHIYFGTNTGLYGTRWANYYTPRERRHFQKVQHSEGQVWSLNEVGGSLLMGHHEGAFEVLGMTAKKLTNLQGVWKFVPISPAYAVAGHYNGLAFFKKTPAGWGFEATLSGLTESSRLLAKDDQGNIWMAHPYRGIFRVRVNLPEQQLSADFFDQQQGLPSALGNHLFQLGENIVFTGEMGIFNFSREQNRFLADANFEQIFGPNAHVRYLKQDQAGNIWYATDRETGLLMVENNTLGKNVRRVPIPELSARLTVGFQFILPVDQQNVFVATDQGFIHFNPAVYFSQKDSSLRLVLHEVRLKNGADSVLYGGNLVGQEGPAEVTLSARQNSLAFAFSATDYPGSEFVRYSHFLEGADQDWSDWTSETDLIFNNLHPGEYTFRLKARNQHGVESPVLSFRFTVLPPWYASQWAYLFYFLMLAGLVLGFIYRQQRRFALEKRGLVNLHQQQTRHSEEAINRLENEKLEAEVRHKNQELASATLHIVQKSEILNAIKDELESLQHKAISDPKLEREISHIIKMLEQDARTDADWEQFSHHFDQVHSDFLKRLGEQHAHLSPNDYKLCAYLRLNLSSKEIAALMNISLRGVESSRYRLRKRLGLDTEANLTDFLMRF